MTTTRELWESMFRRLDSIEAKVNIIWAHRFSSNLNFVGPVIAATTIDGGRVLDRRSMEPSPEGLKDLSLTSGYALADYSSYSQNILPCPLKSTSAMARPTAPAYIWTPSKPNLLQPQRPPLVSFNTLPQPPVSSFQPYDSHGAYQSPTTQQSYYPLYYHHQMAPNYAKNLFDEMPEKQIQVKRNLSLMNFRSLETIAGSFQFLLVLLFYLDELLQWDPGILRQFIGKGITNLFPIQKGMLKPAMQGCDMFGRARTGTRKTLAFGISIMDKIIEFNKKYENGRNLLALVMDPTRELAQQFEKEFQQSAPILDTIFVYGGTPIPSQIKLLGYGVDVVVGTLGRIIDLMKRGALNLSEVRFVVLVEADQMLSVGFAKVVDVIMEKLPHKCQTMMFLATRPTWIRELVKKHMNSSITIDLVGEYDQKLADGITLYAIPSDMHGKASIISPLITALAKGGNCFVFTQTKRDADRLAYAMAKSLKCEAIHGDISQSQRERTLSDFRDGHFNVLVATDVASHGLDIPNVDLVIHYELPNTSETFVHRSGYTGCARKKGTTI